MGRIIRTRELLDKFPWLDRVRMDVLGWIANHGSSYFDRSYNRVRVIAPQAEPFVNGGKRHILALYHGHMIAILGMKPRKRTTVLISDSRDGEMIARGIGAMGFSIARGSSYRGAVKGGLQMIEAAKAGQNLAFMVDGPRGPLHEVKPGIIRMAAMTGLPIIPVGHYSRSILRARSWDNWHGTVWGSPEITVFGAPILVPEELSESDLEKLRVELEESMHKLDNAVEQFWPRVGEGEVEVIPLLRSAGAE